MTCHAQHSFYSVTVEKAGASVSHRHISSLNKGIDFIDLPSIFRDNRVIDSIPKYFKNSEVPIICYKYNKPVRNIIFNYNKIVSDLDIQSNTPTD